MVTRHLYIQKCARREGGRLSLNCRSLPQFSGFARGLNTHSKKTTQMVPFIRLAPLCEGAIHISLFLYSFYWSVQWTMDWSPPSIQKLNCSPHGQQEECGNPGCVDDVRCYVHKGDAPLPSLDRPYIFCWVMGGGGGGQGGSIAPIISGAPTAKMQFFGVRGPI